MRTDIMQAMRKRAGLTQVELAKKLGVSRSSVCAYEAGTREPSNETILKMCSIFGCSVDHLLTGKSGLVSKWTPEADAVEEYNAELAALLEDLKTREDMRILFRLAHDASPDDVKAAVKIIEALRKE